jgi:HEAT repeat protein
MKPSGRYDRDLVQIALNSDYESDAYCDAVRELQKRGTREVFEISSELCDGEEMNARRVGLDVLGQLGYEQGRPFLAESLPIALRLADDTEQAVRRSALAALGNLGDAQALPVLLSHMADPDAGTRLVVAQAMPSVLADPPQPEGVRALIRLSDDGDPQVRDWATFDLGSLLDVDSAEIRNALSQRLNDPEGDAAGEALVGLARRRDPEIVARVRALLNGEQVGNLTVEAAGELAERTFLPSLERLRQAGWAEGDPRGWLLEKALTACRDGTPMNE